MPMKLDDAFSQIGDYGRGQVLIFVIICSIGQLPASWHIFAIVFLGATPEYGCRPAVDDAGDAESLYLATENNFSYDRGVCDTIDSNTTLSTFCENGWVYSDEMYSSMIVSQWDLICDRAGYVEYSQTVLMVGVMVGSYLAGYLADRFGRKPVLFVALFAQGIVGIIQAFSSSFTMFIVVRFVIGIVDQGYELPLYSMVSELFTPRWRPYSFICMMNFGAGGILSLPVIAYFIRDWRYLQLAISIPFLFLPVFYWVIPESPRWLLSIGRHEEAAAIVTKIARFNGKKDVIISFSPEETDKEISKESMFQSKNKMELKGPSNRECMRNSEYKPEKDKPTETDPSPSFLDGEGENTNNVYDQHTETKTQKNRDDQVKLNSNSYLELFNGYQMSLVTSVMCITWFVTSFSYYGLSLNAGRIAGDPYLNFFLSGAIEIPSHFLATGIVVWFGRRWPICIFLLITGVASVTVSFIPEETATGEDLTAAIVITAMIGKFSIALVYAIVCLYASEIFPTVVRNKGIGLVSIAARVGALLAPFVLLLETTLPKAPMILLGTMAIVPSLLVLLIPEMKGRHQPETIADLNALFAEDKQRRISLKLEREMNLKISASNTNEGFMADTMQPGD